MAGENEGRLRVMEAGELGGKARGVAPRGEDAENPEGRPHGVGGEVQEVFQAIRFGLVALGNLGGDAAPDGEACGEVGAGGGVELGEFSGGETGDAGGIATPGDDVVEDDVAVGDENLAVGEREFVDDGNIGVVVAGDDGDRESCGCYPRKDFSTEFGGKSGAGASAGIEGVSVKDEVRRAVEQWTELREAVHATSVVAIVDVREDAGKGAGHGGIDRAMIRDLAGPKRKRGGRCDEGWGGFFLERGLSRVGRVCELRGCVYGKWSWVVSGWRWSQRRTRPKIWREFTLR